MKNVIRQYAAAVIAVVVGLGILGILYNNSFGNYQTLYRYLGSITERLVAPLQTTYKTGTEFDACMKIKLPEIESPDYKELAYGVYTDIGTVIASEDGNGDKAVLSVNKIWNEEFEKTKDVEVNENNQIILVYNGVYWLEVTTTDNEGNSRTVLLRICGGKL